PASASAAVLFQKLGAMVLVALESPFDAGERSIGGTNLLDLHLLAFELLVVLEEALENEEPMRGKVAGFEIAAELGIVGGAGVDHGHEADGAGFDERERLHRFLAKDEHIERIVVLGVSLRDEAVIG